MIRTRCQSHKRKLVAISRLPALREQIVSFVYISVSVSEGLLLDNAEQRMNITPSSTFTRITFELNFLFVNHA